MLLNVGTSIRAVLPLSNKMSVLTPLHPPRETEREAQPATSHTAASNLNAETVKTSSLWIIVSSMVWMSNLPSL
jgi:hypothetical protein